MSGFVGREGGDNDTDEISEEDLTSSLEAAMEKYPNTYAVLVRRHGIYVWGDNVHKAKTQAER